MTYRWMIAMSMMVLSVGHGWAAPIPVVKYEAPTVKMQLGSPAKLLAFLESASNSDVPRGGGGSGPITPQIREMLSEKQLAKLAKGKPIGVALYLRDKAEETSMFIAVPFTSEKAGVEFLEGCNLRIETDKANAGLSFLIPPGKEANKMFRISFAGDTAFIGINAKPEAFGGTKLPPYSFIVDEKNTADVWLEANLALVPESNVKWLTDNLNGAKQSVAQMQANPAGGMPKEFPTFAATWLGWMTRNLEAIQIQAETVSIAIAIDDKTLNNTWTCTVKPKAKSELAASIAKHPASEGRFDQLLTEKIVVGKSLSITGTPKDTGKQTVEMVLWQFDQGIRMIPNVPVQNLCTLASDQLKAQAAADKVDFAVALHDANSKGQFSGIMALAIPDPANLEKTWKAGVADWAKEDKELVKLDAEKIGEVNVHTITYKTVPKEIAETFGKEVVIRIGFGAKAMFLAVGPDGGKLIETAAALKTKPSRVMALDYHNGRLKTFAAKLGMPVEQLSTLDRMFGKSDGKLPFYDVIVTPGETLVVMLKQNRLGIMSIFSGFFGIH